MIYLVGLIAGFGLLGAYFVLEVGGVAHELRPTGFLRVSPWGPRRFIPWSQVTMVRYGALMTAWRIQTASGDSAWVASNLSGIAAFARGVLDNVPSKAIDRKPGTRAMLFGFKPSRGRQRETGLPADAPLARRSARSGGSSSRACRAFWRRPMADARGEGQAARAVRRSGGAADKEGAVGRCG